MYPIIGAGSVPFRGHLTPVNIDRAFREYPSAHTLTVQSAFKYDYDKDTVRHGIAQILDHERGDPVPIDQERGRELVDRTTAEYQSHVRRLIGVISSVSANIPKRRERKLHVGLFGYGRSLGGVGDDVTLPRAIGFAASMYSIGVPPELLDLAALSPDDLSFVREVYPSIDDDLRAALRFTNERHVKELLGDRHLDIVGPIHRRNRPGPRGPYQRHLGRHQQQQHHRPYPPLRRGSRPTPPLPGVSWGDGRSGLQLVIPTRLRHSRYFRHSREGGNPDCLSVIQSTTATTGLPAHALCQTYG